MASWGKHFLLEFIELFRGEECLWKVTSKDYHNKQKREESYKMLIEKVKEIDPLADKSVVTRKINSLRSAFRKELKKVGRLVSGMGADDVYQPKLWYYDQLLFLADQEAPMKGTSSLATESENESNLPMSRPSTSMETFAMNHPPENLIQIKPDPFEFEDKETDYSTHFYPSTSPSTSNQQKKRKHTPTENDFHEEDEGNPSRSFIHCNTTQNIVHKRSKHQAFLNFISEELDRITDEEILEETKWNIQTCLHNGIKAQRQKFNLN